MSRIILSFILILGCISSPLWAQLDRSQIPKPGPAPKIQIAKAASFTLENGLKVFVVEDHKIPRIAFQLSLEVDPIREKDKVGYIDMAGDLMRRGTKNKDKEQLDREIDFIGASINTNARGAFAVSLKKHSDKLLELFSEIILSPSFPEEELEKLKTEALSGIKANKEDAGAIAANLEDRLRFGANHPYGEVQTEAHIENIKIVDCQVYYQAFFRPNAAYMVVVGDTNPSEAKEMLEKYFGAWKSGTVPTMDYGTVKRPNKTQVAIGNKSGAVQSVISITYPIDYKLGDEDYIPALVMNHILGGSFGTRLNQNLREDKGFTYGAGSGLSQDQRIGYFKAGASVRNEVTDSSVVEFMKELNRIREAPVSAEELDRAKKYLTGSFARSLESPQRIASFALNIARYNLPEDFYTTYLERLNAVSIADVQRVAKKYILPQQAYIIVVGDAKSLEDKLKAFGEVSLYNYYGEEDSGVDSKLMEGMNAQKVMDTYFEAIGGREKAASLKSMQMKAEIEFQGQKIMIEMAKEAPNKSYAIQKLPAAFGGMEMKTVFDGEKGYEQTMQGTKVFEGDKLKDALYQSQMFLEDSYQDLGLKVKLEGLEKVEEKAAFLLVFTSPEGSVFKRWYDAESGLLVKQDSQGQVGTIAGYTEVEGLKMPSSLIISNGMGPLEMKFTEIKLNAKLDPALFKVED